jgi:hypothetical protein
MVKYRLADYKKQYTEHVNACTKRGAKPYYDSWRDFKPKNHGPRCYLSSGNALEVEGSIKNAIGYRDDYTAEDVLKLKYTGWYSDHHQDDIISGHVVVLRLGKFTYFVPYTSVSNGDYYYLDLNLSVAYRLLTKDTFVDYKELSDEAMDILKDAAWAADKMAREEAEESKDAHQEDMAEQKIEELKEEITDSRETIRGLIKDIRGVGLNGFGDNICKLLKDKIKKELEYVRDRKQGIKELIKNPYLIHEWKY